MSDLERGLTEQYPADFVERAIRTLALAIALAGALVALAIYWRPAPPRYQIVAIGDQVVRLNTGSGTMVACNADKCGFVLRESRGIGENSGHALLPPNVPAPPSLSNAAPPAAPAPKAR